MNPTKYKIQRLYSLDQEVVEAFEKFAPSGERSNTLNELLKDYLERHGKMGQDQQAILSEKILRLQALASEVEGMKAKMDAETRAKEEMDNRARVAVETKNFLLSINDRAKAQARVDVLVEMGLDPLSTSVPEGRGEEFVLKWRARVPVVLDRMMKEEK